MEPNNGINSIIKLGNLFLERIGADDTADANKNKASSYVSLVSPEALTQPAAFSSPTQSGGSIA